jgi:hypothetical protein
MNNRLNVSLRARYPAELMQIDKSRFHALEVWKRAFTEVDS